VNSRNRHARRDEDLHDQVVAGRHGQVRRNPEPVGQFGRPGLGDPEGLLRRTGYPAPGPAPYVLGLRGVAARGLAFCALFACCLVGGARPVAAGLGRPVVANRRDKAVALQPLQGRP
jgi:hypothetical protein